MRPLKRVEGARGPFRGPLEGPRREVNKEGVPPVRFATHFGLLGGRRPALVGVVAARGAVALVGGGGGAAAGGLIRGFGLVSLRLGKRRHLDAWLCGFGPDSLAAGRVRTCSLCTDAPRTLLRIIVLL